MRNHLYNLPRWIGWQVTLFCIIDLYFSKVYPAHTSSKLCKVIHLVEVPWLFQFSRPCLWANGSSPICVVACDTTNQHNFATMKNRNAQKCNHLWYIYASLKTFSLNRNLSTQCTVCCMELYLNIFEQPPFHPVVNVQLLCIVWKCCFCWQQQIVTNIYQLEICQILQKKLKKRDEFSADLYLSLSFLGTDPRRGFKV